jgi:hypothetical protein
MQRRALPAAPSCRRSAPRLSTHTGSGWRSNVEAKQRVHRSPEQYIFLKVSGPVLENCGVGR